MSDRGVRSISSRSGQLVSSGQLVWVDYASPPTSDGHIFFSFELGFGCSWTLWKAH